MSALGKRSGKLNWLERRIPTREAGGSIKPGVERSGAPGQLRIMSPAHEVGDSGSVKTIAASIARFTGSKFMYV